MTTEWHRLYQHRWLPYNVLITQTLRGESDMQTWAALPDAVVNQVVKYALHPLSMSVVTSALHRQTITDITVLANLDLMALYQRTGGAVLSDGIKAIINAATSTVNITHPVWLWIKCTLATPNQQACTQPELLSLSGCFHMLDGPSLIHQRWYHHITKFHGVNSFVNDTDTMHEPYYQYPVEDIIAVNQDNKLFFFTRPEYPHLLSTGRNPWTQTPLPVWVTQHVQQQLIG